MAGSVKMIDEMVQDGWEALEGRNPTLANDKTWKQDRAAVEDFIRQVANHAGVNKSHKRKEDTLQNLFDDMEGRTSSISNSTIVATWADGTAAKVEDVIASGERSSCRSQRRGILAKEMFQNSDESPVPVADVEQRLSYLVGIEDDDNNQQQEWEAEEGYNAEGQQRVGRSRKPQQLIETKLREATDQLAEQQRLAVADQEKRTNLEERKLEMEEKRAQQLEKAIEGLAEQQEQMKAMQEDQRQQNERLVRLMESYFGNPSR